jgi:uncharacterized cupredoxin-like copper-binding protein
MRVQLGTSDGAHVFEPNSLTFETGKLYKLVLSNPSPNKHYFTSPGFASKVFTRKVEVIAVQRSGGSCRYRLAGSRTFIVA